MKTVNDIMYFINDLCFLGYLGNYDYKKFDCVRKILVNEIENLDSEKLTNVLGIIDDLYISFRRREFGHAVDKVELLRENILRLVNDEVLVNDRIIVFVNYLMVGEE